MKIHTYFFVILFFASMPLGNAQTNLNYLYDIHAEVKCSFTMAKADNQKTIWTRLYFGMAEADQYQISYKLTNDPSGRKVYFNDSLPLPHAKLRNQIINIDLSAKPEATWIFINIKSKQTGKDFMFFYDLQQAASSLYITDDANAILTQHYIRKGEKATINSLSPNHDQATVYYYAHIFPQADSPLESTTVGSSLPIDTTFTITLPATVDFSYDGLYFIQTDTNKSTGLSFIITDPYYPKLALVDDIAHSLIYITTADEYNKIMDAPDRKIAMDKFWLELLKSPEKAKGTIKRYYQGIEEANYLFTNYKEGWKTDMGMIYLIFGPPQQVYSYGNKEEWIYTMPQDNSRISFTFVSVPSIFSGTVYALIREKRYNRHWYPALELWRKGRK